MDTGSASTGSGPRRDHAERQRRRGSLSPTVQISWPQGSDLTRAYFRGDGAATRFYAGPHAQWSTFEAVARGIDERFGEEERRKILPALRGRAAADEARLQAWVEGGGYVVTTGQQAGLLTGPLFTLHKALTAISLASRLEARLGRPVLPVFWIASEDHDWEEASHTYLLDRGNELVRLDAVAAEPPADRAIFQVPLAGPEHLLEPLGELLIPNDFRDACLTAIEEAYPPGASLADGFESLLDRFLGDRGLLIVRAEDPTLKTQSVPVLRAAIERGDELEGLLAERSSALEVAGYHEQVVQIPGGLQVFEEGETGRTRLYRSNGDVRVGKEGPTESADSVLERLETSPGSFSPNALLRPVVEASALPVLAYVAGPGEAAYYAQNAVLYDVMGVGMPVVYPRAGVQVIEGKVEKVLQKYGLGPDHFSEPVHELATRLARDEMPEGVQGTLKEIRSALGTGAARLLAAAREIDPTLKGPITQARNQSLQAFQEAEKKILQAIKRRNEVVEGQLRKAAVNLRPSGKPQERVLNVFHFLSRYGPTFMDEVADAVDGALPEPS